MNNEYLQKFADNLKKYRILRNLSQEKLSEIAGISTDYISLIERGKRTPSLKRLCLIADALDIEPYILLK